MVLWHCTHRNTRELIWASQEHGLWIYAITVALHITRGQEDMDKITIEKNVPMPVRRKSLPPLPLPKMEVGDSIVVEMKHPADKAAIRQRLVRYEKSHPPVKFSMNNYEKTMVRIHRIKDKQCN